MSRVTGTVRGAAGAEVLLFGPGEPPPLLAAGLTDAGGAFALEPAADAPAGPATVLVKLKGDPVGVLARDVELPDPAPVELELPARVSSLTARIESDAGYPQRLTLSLDPVRPEAVPERLWPFVHMCANGAFESSYDTRSFTGTAVTARVLPGAWRVSARFIDLNRPNILEPDFRNYETAGARSEPDGAALEGTSYRGFGVDVDSDREVRLILREVPDEEL